MRRNRILQKICLTLICLAFLFVPADAQNGRWVEHSLDSFDTGTPLITRGDGCLGYTRDVSDKLLVFDIHVHNWLEITLKTQQEFLEFTTEGQIVFAIGDNLLFGYSAVTQTWDTTSYVGDYMVGGEYYYGCGDSLAYFVTRSYMYVFDAALGYWQYYDYSFTSELGYGVSWEKDDYVAMALSRDYPNQPKNVVYSAHTHSFNQLEYGIGRPSPLMDHGFAGVFDINYSGDDYKLIGYSAFSNTFDVVDYSCEENESIVGGTGAGALLQTDKFTVKTQTFRAVVPNESVTANFYGFDTRRGSWDHTVKYFDWDVDHYYGGWYQCGQFAFDQSLYTDDNSFHIYFYSGIDGQFRDYSSGIIYKSTTSSFRGGGTVFCVYDTLHAWAYDVAGDRGKNLDFALDKTANFERGEDFLTLTRWSTDSETMVTYFYNGNTNQWSSVVLPEHRTTDGIMSSHMYMHCGSPEREMIFYSAYQDEIVKIDFTDGLSVDYKIREGMAYARSDEKSILYDGYDGQFYEFDFEFDRYGLGARSAVFCDTANDIWYGYSTLSKSFSTLATEEKPYYCRDTGYVGMVTVDYISKCYAYNGLGDGWVELIPEGNHVSGLLGKKTILITRSDRVYAFDPEVNPTDISDNNKSVPRKYTLSQNYPNPFNPSTNISFSLPRTSNVNLNIYNLLGRKIKTLISKEMEAGNYDVKWNGKDMASGIYFYRIKIDDFSETKKMLLLK
ncbi:MAG: T9SS type A sorting domain-containing protein [candidate division Zixibacteria bacterium]|nr:T9SS type A sorting domain-containing protein [candidate division Zixibacteria bacterium]